MDRPGPPGLSRAGTLSTNLSRVLQRRVRHNTFPTHVRYTGSALAYTAANLIAGATLPATAVWLLRAFHGSPWSVVGIVVFWNGLSLIMVLIGRETRGINLDA